MANCLIINVTDKCVGCRYGIETCPYGVRYFNKGEARYFAAELTPSEEFGYPVHKLGEVEKCDFCTERLERDQEPACVANCPAVARIFGDLDDPESEVSLLIKRDAGFQLLAELGNDPSVYYLPAERPAKESR